uniref:Uncharacterized protein n=1 Tax=Schistocephalus solidus TaxID=70667 RepID=A0A0X3Q2B5_SCHSO
MIELSTSWELQGRRKLSDVLAIREVHLDELEFQGAGSPLTCDTSKEFTTPAVVLQPFLHPEFPSSGACCILIRLATHRRLRIVQLVVVSSSPHVDLVDRYGEPLAHVEGVCACPGTSCYVSTQLATTSDGETLFYCCSGRLSPHIECVVRFSETQNQKPLVIRHIGVYTTVIAADSLAETGEAHAQELIQLSSYVGSADQVTRGSWPRSHGSASSTSSGTAVLLPSPKPIGRTLQLSQSSSFATTTMPPTIQSNLSAWRTSSPQNSSLPDLCTQLLSNSFSNSPDDFWQPFAAALLTAVVRLAVRESVEQSSADSERVLRAVLADAMKAYVSPPAPAVDSATNSTAAESILAAGTTPSTAASTLPHGKILSGISQLSSNFDKLGASLKRQLDDISERISRLEALSHTSPTPANCDLSKATSGEEDRGKTASGDP